MYLRNESASCIFAPVQILGVSERRWSFRRSLGTGGTGKICMRLMHCLRRAFLRISVSSATDEVFSVVKDLGLSD